MQRVASRQSSTATQKKTPAGSSAAGRGANRPTVAGREVGRTSKQAPKKQAPNPQKRAQRTPTAAETEQTSDRYIWGSLTLLFLAGYLAVSTISYLIYWDVDQNIATWGNLFTDLRQDAMNWGGRIGAILANSIIGRWFGIFGELFPLVVFFLAIKLLRLRSMRLRRAIRSTIL
ncbi:MAG: DNA translocase FtsK 4TM domain-containing protein, partial [Rikenella sp.]|nr:DNA translocase FtsK 4TM domain-containing protein [Rikenella sp.]